MSYSTITVAGGGNTGSQIAFMSALHGKDTTIWGFNDESIKAAKQLIQKWSQVVQDYTHCSDQQIKDAKNHLSYTTNLRLATLHSDIMIEALPEDVATKRDFYETFSRINDNPRMDVVTSSTTLLPAMLSEAIDRPNRFLACTFTKHIWENNTVNILSHAGTDQNMPDKIAQLAQQIGMEPTIIKNEQLV